MSGVSLNPQDMIDWEGFKHSRFAADNKGHSARMSFRIQPQILRVMSELVREFGEEYKEPADLIRHAIREHIRRLQAYREAIESDRITSTMAQVDAMLEILAMESEQADFELTIVRAKEVLTKMYNLGAKGEFLKTLNDLKRQVSTMKSDFWREKYLKQLKQEFGHMMTEVEGAPMGAFSDDE